MLWSSEGPGIRGYTLYPFLGLPDNPTPLSPPQAKAEMPMQRPKRTELAEALGASWVALQ